MVVDVEMGEFFGYLRPSFVNVNPSLWFLSKNKGAGGSLYLLTCLVDCQNKGLIYATENNERNLQVNCFSHVINSLGYVIDMI